MNELGKWIRRRFRANVEGGTGAWSTAANDPVLGSAIYEYDDGQVCLTVYDAGLAYTRAGVEHQWLFSDISEVVVLPLTELVKVHRDPKKTVQLGLNCAGVKHGLHIPMELYSELAPMLCGAVDRSAPEEGGGMR